MKEFLYFILLPYLIGSIPSGLILTKLCGHGDIRNIGSGNIGATNVLRTGNKWLAAYTLLLDGLKGVIACKVSMLYFFNNALLENVSAFEVSSIMLTTTCTAGLLSIIGHIFPAWLKFKGGKGVATTIGVIFALNAITGLYVISVWLLTFSISRISSLSALTAFFVATITCEIPFVREVTYRHNYTYPAFVYFMCIATLIIFLTHKENISRLIKGEEHVWRKR